MKWRVSPQDVARGKLVQKPGWYPAEITSYNEETSKKGDSTNVVIDFTLHGEGVEGITIRQWFNEKAPGIAVPFLKALGAEEQADGSMDLDLTDKLVGRRLQVYVKRGEFDNKPKNEISDYSA